MRRGLQQDQTQDNPIRCGLYSRSSDASAAVHDGRPGPHLAGDDADVVQRAEGVGLDHLRPRAAF